MRLRIEHDLKHLERDLGSMASTVMPKAVPPAINRVTKTVQSVAVKEISGVTGIKQKEVRKDIRTKLADKVNMTAYVDAKAGRAKNIAHFVTPARKRPSEGPGKPQFFRKRRGRKGQKVYTHRGVTAKAWQRSKTYAGTFIARGKSNNVLAFLRVGPGRNADIDVVHGPSIRKEFDREPMRNSMTSKANERFPIEMERSLSRALRRYRKK